MSLAAGAAASTGRGIVLPGRRIRREEAAIAVESGFPELGQSVRTTLEYVEPTPATAPAPPGPRGPGRSARPPGERAGPPPAPAPASSRLVDALVADTDRRTEGLDFRG